MTTLVTPGKPGSNISSNYASESPSMLPHDEMIPLEFLQLLQRQRQFFLSGKARGLAFRKAQLRKLRDRLKQQSAEIVAAVSQDTGRCREEIFSTELNVALASMDAASRELDAWMHATRRHMAESTNYQPYGLVYIVGDRLSPILSLLGPAISALAAGNTVVLSPGTMGASSAALGRLIEYSFSPESCTFLDSNWWETQAGIMLDAAPNPSVLAAAGFDRLIYTGSRSVGVHYAQVAAANLTPALIYCGGKAPVLIDKDVDLAAMARHLVHIKFRAAGQSRFAPDYALVQRDCVQDVLGAMRLAITDLYGIDPAESLLFPRLSNQANWQRLVDLIKPRQVQLGGVYDVEDFYLAPTVLTGVKPEDPIMQSEVYGPILPVLEYSHLADAMQLVRQIEHQSAESLVAYAYTQNASTLEPWLKARSAGIIAVNDVSITGYEMLLGRAGFINFSRSQTIVRGKMTRQESRYHQPGKARRLVQRLLG